MSKNNEFKPLIMSKKSNTIANDMAILNEVFEKLRTELNEMKVEGRLNHDDISILPFTLGLMQETARAFIESRAIEDEGQRIISRLVKDHIEEIIPWESFLKYTKGE